MGAAKTGHCTFVNAQWCISGVFLQFCAVTSHLSNQIFTTNSFKGRYILITLLRTSLPLQANFYSAALPIPDLSDDRRRGYILLVERNGSTFKIPLKYSKYLAVVYLMYDYVITFLGGPERLLCFPGSQQQQVGLCGCGFASTACCMLHAILYRSSCARVTTRGNCTSGRTGSREYSTRKLR